MNRKIKLRDLVRRIPRGTKFRSRLVRLMGQEGMEDLPVDMPVPAAEPEGLPPEEIGEVDEQSAEDQVKSAFRALVMAAFDDESLDTAGTIARIKEILQSQEQLQPAPGPAAAPAAEDEYEEPTMETLQAQLESLRSENNCRALLESSGVASSPVRLKAMARLSGSERTELVEGWQTSSQKRNRKPMGSRPRHESGGGSWKTQEDFIAGLKS